MKKKKYIGLIHEERDDDYTIGYGFTNDLRTILNWKEKMDECGNIEDCKILEVKEVDVGVFCKHSSDGKHVFVMSPDSFDSPYCKYCFKGS